MIDQLYKHICSCCATLGFSIVVFAIVFCLYAPSYAADKPYVVFANPGGKDDVFFQLMNDFMQAAADDLGFELDVYYGDRNHVMYDENLDTIFRQDRLPDYLIGMDARGSGITMLEKAEARGVKTIFINQGFLGEVRETMGGPGERYKHWLFEFLPDDTHSGYTLAKVLIEKALSNGLVDEQGVVNVVAINGHEKSSASILREEGLKRAIGESPNARLLQVAHAGWKREKAQELTEGLLKRYPQVKVIWSASDMMGLGITEGIRMSGRSPGENVLTGGVDWANFALDLVEKGDFTVSVGGHFMDGGWALVMLYDQIHGVDTPRSSTSTFSQITKENVGNYRKYVGGNDWGQIDFTKFSKHLNPKLKEYDFGLNAVLDQVEGR